MFGQLLFPCSILTGLNVIIAKVYKNPQNLPNILMSHTTSIHENKMFPENSPLILLIQFKTEKTYSLQNT